MSVATPSVVRMTLEAVILALRESWGPDTCAPEDVADWTPDNPARGQCATTAVVLHDFFGGSLMVGEVIVDGERVDFHWWNRLPDGEQVDITLEQFGAARARRRRDGGRASDRHDPPRRAVRVALVAGLRPTWRKSA